MQRTILLIIALLILTGSYLSAQHVDEGIQLIVPDGQLTSFPIRVFVTHDITDEMDPRLMLSDKSDASASEVRKMRSFSDIGLARNQTWIDTIGGQTVSLKGTLLLFDLKRVDMAFYDPLDRIIPILTWTEKMGKREERHQVFMANAVYLGHRQGAIVLTLTVLVVFIAMLIILCRKADKKLTDVFLGRDGRYSLYKSQVVAWTIVVGSLVAMFGLFQLEVPSIPESLVVLMGLSLGTTSLGAYLIESSQANNDKNGRKQDSKGKTGLNNPSNTPANNQTNSADEAKSNEEKKLPYLLAGLIADSKGNLSLPQFQMFFWTILMLLLFVVKSINDGMLWNVPWEMVAFTGMSQSVYIGEKIMNKQKKTVPVIESTETANQKDENKDTESTETTNQKDENKDKESTETTNQKDENKDKESTETANQKDENKDKESTETANQKDENKDKEE